MLLLGQHTSCMKGEIEEKQKYKRKEKGKFSLCLQVACLATDKSSSIRISYSYDNPQVQHLFKDVGGFIPQVFSLKPTTVHSYNTPSSVPA